MVQHHIDSGSAGTVAGIRQPIGRLAPLGVIDGEGGGRQNFLEKPQRMRPLPDDPTRSLPR